MKRTAIGALGALLSFGLLSEASAEQYYSTAELKKLITGKRATVGPRARVHYRRDGNYRVTINGNTQKGKWFIRRGRVCVNFPNGNRRCDRFVKDGGAVFFENAQGGRYKVKIR